ncbi:MAG: hypothetical protein AAF206_12685 [Bacteroidota bacterium]
MKTGRILFALFMLFFFGSGFLHAQDDPPIYGGIDVRAASNILLWLGEEGGNVYGGGSLGLGADNQGWSACAGLDAVYYPQVDEDARIFPSYGISVHYDYTNEGGADEVMQNANKVVGGPKAGLNLVLVPQVLLHGHVQINAGVGNSTRIEPVTLDRSVDNTSLYGANATAGVVAFLNKGKSQVDISVNVAEITRNMRRNADNPDQRFTTTNARLGLNNANPVQLSYRIRF